MKWLALLAVFAVAACGSIGAQAHTLSLGFKAGDTYKYKFHATSKQTASMTGMTMPIEIDTTATETVKVKSVDAGVADLTITLGDFTLKTVAGGVTNTTTGLPSNSIELKVNSDGTVRSLNGDTMMSGSPLAAFAGIGGGFFVAAVLPDHAVKVGDTWSKAYDQKDPIGTGQIHITSNSKYLRDETVNGVSAAVVETKSDGTIAMTGSPASSTGMDAGLSMNGIFTTDVTTWIDPSGHRVIKSHSTGHDEITLNFPTMKTGGGTTQMPPMMQGSVTATGDSTTDLSPA